MTGKDMLLCMSDLDSSLIDEANRGYELLRRRKDNRRINQGGAMAALLFVVALGVVRGFSLKNSIYTILIASIGIFFVLLLRFGKNYLAILVSGMWICLDIGFMKYVDIRLLCDCIIDDNTRMFYSVWKDSFVIIYPVIVIVIAVACICVKKLKQRRIYE